MKDINKTASPQYFSLSLTLRDDLVVLYTSANNASKITPWYVNQEGIWVEGVGVSAPQLPAQMSCYNPRKTSYAHPDVLRLVKAGPTRFFLAARYGSWGFEITENNTIKVLWSNQAHPVTFKGYLSADAYSGEIYDIYPETFTQSKDQLWVCRAFKMSDTGLYLDRTVKSDIAEYYWDSTYSSQTEIGLQCVLIDSLYSFVLDTVTGKVYTNLADNNYGNFMTSDSNEIIGVNQKTADTMEFYKVTRLENNEIKKGTAYVITVPSLQVAYEIWGSIFGEGTIILKYGNSGSTRYIHNYMCVEWGSDNTFKINSTIPEVYYGASTMSCATVAGVKKPKNPPLIVLNVSYNSYITEDSVRLYQYDLIDTIKLPVTKVDGVTKLKCTPNKKSKVYIWKEM